MGPLNLAKIKAAHEKLLRLDPEFSVGERRNRNTVARQKSRAARSEAAREDAIQQAHDLKFADTFVPDDTSFDTEFERLQHLVGVGPINGSSNRKVKMYEHDGKTQTAAQWAKEIGITSNAFVARIQRKKPVFEARNKSAYKPDAKLYEHDGRSLSLREWSEESGITLGTLRNRIKQGWTIGAALTIAPRAVMGSQSHAHHAGGWIRTSQDALGTAVPPSLDTSAKQGIFQ